MYQNRHLGKDEILKIYDLREKVVVGRKRKYSRKEIEEFLSQI